MDPMTIMTLASTAGQILPFFGAQKKQKKALKEQRNLLDALTNTNNPIFQETYRQQKELGQQNLAETIAEMQRQNRKQIALGRTPIFGGERGGESIFRNIMRGYQDIQGGAANQARNIINTRLQGLSGMYPQEMQANLGRAGTQSILSEFAGSKQGLDMFSKLGSMFGLK